MQSKTSFFNKTVFLKNISRFWPIWASYLAIWSLILPMTILNQLKDAAAPGELSAQLRTGLQIVSMGHTGGVVMAVIFSVVSAMAVYSHLYTAKSAGMTASLPIRRETMFLTNYLSGLVWLVAGNLLVFLITALVELCYGCLYIQPLLQWLGLATVPVFFFYSFASFCAVLTGNIFVLPAVYTILNYTAVVLELTVSSLMELFVYGLAGGYRSLLTFLSPSVEMLYRDCYIANSAGERFRYAYSEALEEAAAGLSVVFNGWQTYLWYALAAVGFVVAGVLLFRRRQMETASDIVAVKPLKPVFKYCMTAGGAIVLSVWLLWLFDMELFGSITVSVLFWMLVGAFVGYFAAEMLMQKSFRVFKKWKGFVVSAAVIVALVLCTEFDVLGYERRVPELPEVRTVTVSCAGDEIQLTREENVAAVLRVHQDLVDNKKRYENYSETGYSTQYVRISYDLGGKMLEREYKLPIAEEDLQDPASAAYRLQSVLNSEEAIECRKTLEIPVTEDTVAYAQVHWRNQNGEYNTTELTYQEVLTLYNDCIVPDMRDGNIGKIWLATDESYYRQVYDCEIYFELSQRVVKNGEVEYTGEAFQTHPTVDSVRVNAWLVQHGVSLVLVGDVDTASEQVYTADVEVIG